MLKISGGVMLLKNQRRLVELGETGRQPQTSNATADNDIIHQVLGDVVGVIGSVKEILVVNFPGIIRVCRDRQRFSSMLLLDGCCKGSSGVKRKQPNQEEDNTN
jgi:hypothetical protein